MPSQEESTLFPAAPTPDVSLERLPRPGWNPSGTSGTSVGVEFCSFFLDPFTTFHPLPRPRDELRCQRYRLSNDDVVRLDLRGLHSGTAASNGRIYLQNHLSLNVHDQS